MSTTTLPDSSWKHPAKWSKAVLPVLARVIKDESYAVNRRLSVLDPFAGVGRPALTEALRPWCAHVSALDIQPEAHTVDTWTRVGSVMDLAALGYSGYDAVVSSPCYGNRMADKHQAKDKSFRHTYAHTLRAAGGELVKGSAGGLQWGAEYRRFHTTAIESMIQAVRPGGLLVINMSDHIRGGETQSVCSWWQTEMARLWCAHQTIVPVFTPRQRHGANGRVRCPSEQVIVMRTPR